MVEMKKQFPPTHFLSRPLFALPSTPHSTALGLGMKKKVENNFCESHLRALNTEYFRMSPSQLVGENPFRSPWWRRDNFSMMTGGKNWKCRWLINREGRAEVKWQTVLSVEWRIISDCRARHNDTTSSSTWNPHLMDFIVIEFSRVRKKFMLIHPGWGGMAISSSAIQVHFSL